MAVNIEVTDYANAEALNDAVYALMREVLGAAETPTAVMLSGGRTPLALFAKTAAQPYSVGPGAWITYTDDRHVPVESPESNYGATLPMIDALGIPRAQVIKVDTMLSLEEAAERYHLDFVRFLEGGGEIPVAFLGLGPDGHTCSLFSQEDIDRGAGRLASPTWRPAPPNRVTVTPGLLERCGKIVFMVAGRDKDEVVAQLLETPAEIPAGRAIARCARVALWRA